MCTFNCKTGEKNMTPTMKYRRLGVSSTHKQGGQGLALGVTTLFSHYANQQKTTTVGG